MNQITRVFTARWLRRPVMAVAALVAGAGFAEYFDPLTGEARGAGRFSWTAALVLDLLAGGGAG